MKLSGNSIFNEKLQCLRYQTAIRAVDVKSLSSHTHTLFSKVFQFLAIRGGVILLRAHPFDIKRENFINITSPWSVCLYYNNARSCLENVFTSICICAQSESRWNHSTKNKLLDVHLQGVSLAVLKTSSFMLHTSSWERFVHKLSGFQRTM